MCHLSVINGFHAYIELKHIFPEDTFDTMAAVATMQRSVVELAAYGDQAETEKDRLLESVSDTSSSAASL